MRLYYAPVKLSELVGAFFCTKGTLTHSREIFAVYALPTASVPNKTYVVRSFSCEKLKNETPYKKGALTDGRSPSL